MKKRSDAKEGSSKGFVYEQFRCWYLEYNQKRKYAMLIDGESNFVYIHQFVTLVAMPLVYTSFTPDVSYTTTFHFQIWQEFLSLKLDKIVYLLC